MIFLNHLAMMKTIKKITLSKWKVARTIWPYPKGYGTYKENHLTGEMVILDTGLPKEEVQKLAKQLNDRKDDTTANTD